jgi:flagellar basal body-associated protein FliL
MNRTKHIGAVGVAGCVMFLAGCGHDAQSAAELEAAELLRLIQKQKHQDPSAYVEADLGKFRVSHVVNDGHEQVHVSFHLVGILPPDRVSRLEELRPAYENRLRDAVISLVQKTETEHLTDPSLSYFKAEVVGAVNRVLQDRVLADAAFSDFSIDPAGQAAWSHMGGGSRSSGHRGH